MKFIKKHEKTLFFLLLLFAVIRLISLYTYPLLDTTEARYGEMARIMVETQNWLTPQFDYDVPFWGKPPLFVWISAVGIELFGVNEFSVRAPHWLAGILSISLTAFMAHRAGFSWVTTALVLITCGLFMIGSGAVMADMVLALSMTITLVGFYYCWLNLNKQGLYWGYCFFIGLAIGLLAKGPLIFLLTGLVIFPWLIIQHGFWGALITIKLRFPVVTGTLLMLLISIPWYIMAEKATPGFLDYFIVGEHFKRFLINGWEGDLYGNAHDEPRGKIWLFWLQSAAPWSLVLPLLMWKRANKIRDFSSTHTGLFSFLVLWLISPMLLFTFAGNILPTYVLPGLPAVSILIAGLVTETDRKWIVSIASIAPTLLVIAIFYINYWASDKRCDKVMFEKITDDNPVFYVYERPFSGQFYSKGQAKIISSPEQLKGTPQFHLIGYQHNIDAVINGQNIKCENKYSARSNRTLHSCRHLGEDKSI